MFTSNINIVKSIFCIGCIILASASFAQDHSINYRVMWKGDSIGYMTAEKKINDNLESYHLITETSMSILFSFDVVATYQTHFEGGNLKFAKTKSSLNKKERSYSKVEKVHGGYLVETEDEKSKFEGSINESIVSMYFQEPLKTTIFSERFGQMCKIDRLEDGTYRLHKPDGRTNYYYYKDGICQGGKINLSLTTINFEKID